MNVKENETERKKERKKIQEKRSLILTTQKHKDKQVIGVRQRLPFVVAMRSRNVEEQKC